MAVRTGDPFRAFYDRTLPEVYGYLLTRLGDASAAERATGEAFEALLPQWPLPANVKYEVAFAVGFARRRLVDAYRRQDQQVKRRRQFAATSSSAAANRTTAAVDLRVHWAMAAVPAMQRAALVLRHVDDLTPRDTAAVIGRMVGVTEFLLTRGSRMLRLALRDVSRTDGFDPLAAMKGLDGPVAPPESFKEELYDELRARLDQSAVGAPEPDTTSQLPLHKFFLVAAVAVAAILLLAGVLFRSGGSDEGPDSTVEPRPLSEPDPPEHNSDPAVISPTTSQPREGQPIRPPAESLGGYQFGGWNVLPASEFDGRAGAAVAWTGEQLFVWGGELRDEGRPSNRGGVLDPAANVWFSLPPAPIPPRVGATALWTGVEVLIVGSGPGAAYEPATRLWRELPEAPIDEDTVAVWAGSEAIVFGPESGGLAYDPLEDAWQNLPAAPTSWEHPDAVWTGAEVIVWDNVVYSEIPTSADSGVVNVAAFDPTTNSWRRFSNPNDVFELIRPRGVWTGEELILWGTDVTPLRVGDSAAVFTGVALNPATDEWRVIASPPFAPLADVFVLAPSPATWTGSRMLIWLGGEAARGDGTEVWAYDPVADQWQRTSGSPITAADPGLLWTGDILYVYGGEDDPMYRTVSLELGPGGDELPDPVGTELVIEGEPTPFTLLTVAANTRRAAIVDLVNGITTVYEPSENLLPLDSLDQGAPIHDGWATVTNGVVWYYPYGIASQPFVLQSEPGVVRPGVAPSAYVTPGRGDLHSGWVWIVEPGFGTLGSSLPTQVHRVFTGGLVRGESLVAGTAYPVASAEAGLLVNVDGEMALVQLDGSVRELWGGIGIGLSSLGRVAWLECDVSGSNCRVRVSLLDGPEPDDLTVEAPGATFGTAFQPGVSQVSPDGLWLVIESHRFTGADSTPSVLLVNLRDGSVVRLADGPLATTPGPSVVWSEDSEWVLLSTAGPTAIRIADGLTVELDGVIPTDMQVYAVASR